MPKNYPHLNDTRFPDLDTVQVYQYQDNYDYKRFDAPQMQITLCSVPWDLGEAHVGQRTIEGVGNVVYFDGVDARNGYFDTLPDDECYRFVTKYRKFHASDETIKVPVPATALADYNYIEIKYYTQPSADEPLEYETNATDRWYYFIREFDQKSANATECVLLLDTWQTFIYFIDVPYMFLERGHYPISRIDADTYLQNPVGNCEWLTGDDAAFGDLGRAGETRAITHNSGTFLACIVTTGNFAGAWGDKYSTSGWATPASSQTLVQGAPAPSVLAVDAGDLMGFLSSANSTAPQFLQTIQGVFFISRNIVEYSSAGALFGHTIYQISATAQRVELVNLNKQMFGYPPEYEDLAKLYTYPYAALDIYAEDGLIARVNIEDTTGSIDVWRKLNYIWPFISLDTQISGIGGDAGVSLTFSQNGYQFSAAGRWYETLKSWEIPCYGVIQSNADYNDFATYWSREQNAYEAQNRLTSENASAATELANTNALAAADLANQEAEANTSVANAAVNTAANSAINTRSNSAAGYDTNLTTNLNQAIQAWNAGFSRNCVRLENTAAENSAAVSAASSAIGSTVNGAISGAGSGGLIGAGIGALSGLVSGAISGATTMAQTAITTDLATDKTEASIGNTQEQVTSTNTNSQQRTDNQQNANTDNTNTQNDAITTTTANSAATTIANAGRTYDAVTGNASRTYGTSTANAHRDYDSAIMRINNQMREAALQAPQSFGSATSAATAATRPIAHFATVRTQNLGAISQAGDMFLRYGYTVSRSVDFETFNVMPKFSFWQCSDLWLRSTFVPDAYMDQIRMLLFGGVTVWRNPEDIGNISIYDNR